MVGRFFVGLTALASTLALSSNSFAQDFPVTSPGFDSAVAASATELLKDVSEYHGYSDLKLDTTQPITFSKSTYSTTDSNPAYLTSIDIGEISFTATSTKFPGGRFSATLKLNAKIQGNCDVSADSSYVVVKGSNPLLKMVLQQDLNRYGDKVVSAFINGSELKEKFCH